MAPPLSSRTPWTTTTTLLLLLMVTLATTHVAALQLPPSYFDACDNDIGPPVIGVDLGNTYTRVGVYRNGRVEKIIAIANDPQAVQGNWTKADDDPNKRPIVVARQPSLIPMEVTAAVALARAKETAEAYLGGEKVAGAVVTVPAHFNEAQRWATKRAGDVLAGLPVFRIVNDSIAASMAYGYGVANADKGGDGDDAVAERKVLVFDLGGATLDVSVLAVDRDGYLETLATSGDSRIGGEDFDRRVADYFVGRVRRRRHGRDVDARAMGKLRRECERAKRALSSQRQVRVEIEKLVDGQGGAGGDLSEQLTRARFEELNGDLFRKTMVLVRKALADAGMRKADIDDVVLVGGGAWIPKVRQLLEDYFDGKEPAWTRGVNPDEAVAYGAALHGAFLDKTRSCF